MYHPTSSARKFAIMKQANNKMPRIKVLQPAMKIGKRRRNVNPLLSVLIVRSIRKDLVMKLFREDIPKG